MVFYEFSNKYLFGLFLGNIIFGQGVGRTNHFETVRLLCKLKLI